MKDILSKVKGQTNSMIQKIFRRGSQETDLLGIESSSSEENKPVMPDPFISIPEANSVEERAISNEDVDDLFGLVSLDAVESTAVLLSLLIVENETPSEVTEESESKHFFKSADNHYSLFLSVLAMGKMVTPAEMQCIREAGESDKKKTLLILQSYLEK